MPPSLLVCVAKRHDVFVGCWLLRMGCYFSVVAFGVLVVGSFLVRCCVVVSSFWVGVSIPRSLLEEEVCWAVSNR